MLQTHQPVPFKTFGAAIDAVREVCITAVKAAYSAHYSTPLYFKKRGEFVHAAFDEYCAKQGLSATAAADLRKQLSSHAAYYRYGGEALRVLFEEIPDTHCVRGQWVSTLANVRVH